MNDQIMATKDVLLNMYGGPFILAAVILGISWLSYLFSCRIILGLLAKLFKQTTTHLDDILVEQGVLNRLAYAVPLLVIYLFSDLFPDYSYVIQQCVSALLVIVFILVVNSTLDAVDEIFSRSNFSQQLNIKSYLQISKLILNILASIVVIAILIDKSPIYLLSGIGALTAVLLLIFKDTILSFVASIQIHSNDLFKIGDWLEAPQFGADGDVIDIALHTVKIQNWDKTISIIPSHKLIASSFKNWRGMSESGGRRIKRAINIDQTSIHFCDEKMINKFKSIELLAPYLESKISEIEASNSGKNIDMQTLVNGRRLTNIGTFRTYIEAYLKSHPMIHDKHTFLVRQLTPSEKGLPIEIYVFTNITDWLTYEAIQSDIFDHLLAVLTEFDLQVFQNPTGKNFEQLKY
ncbi:Small-conductance mechanosensitive channel [hydrothermal vent metagenome]|uniref:Small-conductance mechanosensitive channel n=1 Tax=hydrothermal vent metagenome TaxID=652676 RepID=A0A3B0WJQ3_9ZZZZ